MISLNILVIEIELEIPLTVGLCDPRQTEIEKQGKKKFDLTLVTDNSVASDTFTHIFPAQLPSMIKLDKTILLLYS